MLKIYLILGEIELPYRRLSLPRRWIDRSFPLIVYREGSFYGKGTDKDCESSIFFSVAGVVECRELGSGVGADRWPCWTGSWKISILQAETERCSILFSVTRR